MTTVREPVVQTGEAANLGREPDPGAGNRGRVGKNERGSQPPCARFPSVLLWFCAYARPMAGSGMVAGPFVPSGSTRPRLAEFSLRGGLAEFSRILLRGESQRVHGSFLMGEKVAKK